MEDVTFTKAPFEDETNVNMWPRYHAKYCDILKVIALENPFINEIIRHAPIVGDRKKVLIDVRTQFLEIGFHSTTPGWHRDTPEDPRSLHHLYVVGENRTKFDVEGEVKELPRGYYATYDGTVWHKGVEVTVPEFRLFVRIEELDQFIAEGNYPELMSSYRAKYPVGSSTYFIDEEEYYDTFKEHYDLSGAPDV